MLTNFSLIINNRTRAKNLLFWRNNYIRIYKDTDKAVKSILKYEFTN
jgi:hypothetical protein